MNVAQFCAAVYSGMEACTSAHERSMLLRAFEICAAAAVVVVVIVVVASIDSCVR